MAESKLWTNDFIIIGLVNFLTAINFYLLMVVVSGYAMQKFGSSPGEAGFSASIFIGGALCARLLSGRWITQYGFKKTLYIGAGLSLVMTLLYFAANGFIPLLLIRFLHGAAFGITTTSAGTIVANIIPRDRSGEGIGYYGLSQTIATAIGPFLGIFLYQHGSFDMIFTACTVAAAAGLVAVPILSLDEISVTVTKERAGETKRFRLGNFVEIKVIPISLICMLVFICYSSVVSFLTVYTQTIKLVDAASIFFIVYAAVIILTRPAVGRWFDAKGENSIMYSAIIVLTAGMATLSHTTHSYTLLLAGAFIGFGVGAIQSSTQAISVKITPRHRLGLANSTYFMLCDIGMALGPILAGLVVPYTNYRGMYLGMSLVSLLCLLLYYWLHGKEQRSLQLDRIEFERS